MTTFKHALGYNKDGVLGVAGILGNGAISNEQPGILFWPNSYSNIDRQFKFLTSFEAELITSEEGVRAAAPNVSASGNGLIALGFSSSYAPVGTSLLKVVKSDGSVTDVDIPGINLTAYNPMYGGTPPIGVSGISFSGNKFMIFLYDNSGPGVSTYVTTEDFETFSEQYGLPAEAYLFNNNYSFFEASNGDYYIATNGSSLFKSSDLVTWTSVSAYTSHPTLSPYNFAQMIKVGDLSDGRQVVQLVDSNILVSINESAKLGDVFADMLGAEAELEQIGSGSLPYDFRNGFVGVVDDMIFGGGYMGGTSIQILDLALNLITSTSLGNQAAYSMYTRRINGVPFVTYSTTNFDVAVEKINAISAQGVVDYETIVVPGYGQSDNMSYGLVLRVIV
jgi:hypothetical protein